MDLWAYASFVCLSPHKQIIMVLRPDVFEANWECAAAIAVSCEDIVKQATALYQKVPMVLCVLSGPMILLCVSLLSHGL